MIFSGKDRKDKGKELQLLSLELREIIEISDLLMDKMTRKIELLQSLETSVGSKISELKELEVMADRKIQALRESVRPGSSLRKDDSTKKYDLVLSLHRNGLSVDQIAASLDMPLGEVELILNLNMIPCRS